MQSVETAVEATPAHFSAIVEFLRWASIYGHEIRPVQALEQGVSDIPLDGIEMSTSLSQSFNFAYEREERAVYLALDADEFEWLPQMPISEVVIGSHDIYILTQGVELGDETIGPMVFTVKSGMPRLWSIYPEANTVGFVSLRHTLSNGIVTDVAAERYPLRRLND